MTEKVPSQMSHQFPPIEEVGVDDDYVIFCDFDSHSMHFAVVLCGGFSGEGVLFPKQGAVSSSDTTTDPDGADLFVNGWIKWDGCTDLTIGGGDEYHLHFCGQKDARKLGRLIDRLYELAKEHVVAFDPGLADME